MRRMLAAALIAAVALLSVTATASAGSGGSPERTYVRYAKIRDQVYACVLDRTYRHLGQERRRVCPRYRRLYRLYSFFGSSEFFLFCRTSRCPRQPIGVGAIRGSIPRFAVVYVP